jgi:rhamnogalacturonan endolyase
MSRPLAAIAMAAGLFVLTAGPALGQRQMEALGRGVVAVRTDATHVFVSWRLLGTDADDTTFNLYRSQSSGAPTRLNDKPLTTVTYFVDDKADSHETLAYFVRPVVDGRELAPSGKFTLAAGSDAKPYLSVPLQTPSGYAPNDCSVGDLDGDGEYEIVVHMAGRGYDNSRNGVSDPPILQAYTLSGSLLWTINLGPNIREGAHYTQFLVYDFDGDGRAELICKTADGTTDGRGKVIGDAKANYVNAKGHVLSGPEFLTVFDGRTGAALDTVPYVPTRTEHHPEDPDLKEYRSLWGDDRGNRGERYLACVAYLDGHHPSAVMCRGYYARTTLAAWDFKGGKLTKRWLFDTGPDKTNPYYGQGHHNLSVADVDGDGKDEIIYGDMCVNADGTGRYSTGCGHGDTLHVGDLDPTRPGLEVFSIQERFSDAGAHMFDASTGKILWKKPSVKAATRGGDKGEGPGRGVCFDIDPRYPGNESWTAGAGVQGVWDAKGNQIGTVKPRSCNFAVWWDGDVLRELLDGNHIDKWNWKSQQTERILTADDCKSNNGTKSTPCLSADILGDWREEVIWRTSDNRELRIYTTTIPTDRRFYTFMHDPQYRLSIAWQNVAYNQPPHTSFFVGEGMKEPPRPNITAVGALRASQ